MSGSWHVWQKQNSGKNMPSLSNKLLPESIFRASPHESLRSALLDTAMPAPQLKQKAQDTLVLQGSAQDPFLRPRAQC